MSLHRLSSRTGAIVQAGALLDAPCDDRLVVDVRLGEPVEELARFREGHIHGAVHAQIRDVFAARPTETSGSLPLPDVGDLQRRLRSWGVGADTEIVLVGPTPALAARGWWVLRWSGMRDVKILDGGLKAWVAAGGAVAEGDAKPRTGSASLSLRGGHLQSITVEEVEALGPETLLLDARDESAFLAGAIPGAVNLPASELWTPGSMLRTVDETASLLRSAGALEGRPVVAYCGGGVLSALTVLVLSAFDVQPRLFVGSWSEWSRSAARMARSVNDRLSA